jgi:hypothetical protein
MNRTFRENAGALVLWVSARCQATVGRFAIRRRRAVLTVALQSIGVARVRLR